MSSKLKQAVMDKIHKLENTLFEGAALLEQRANSIPSK